MTLPSRNRTEVCGATIRCVAITPRGALHRLRLLPFILSSSRGNRGIEPRPWEAQSQMLPLHQLPRSSSCRSSCRELPLPELNRGRPRDNRPCCHYTKGDSDIRHHPSPPACWCRSACRRSSSDSNSTSGSVLLLRTLSGAIWFAVRFLTEMGWLSISTWPSNCIDLGPHAGSAPSDHFTTQAPFIPAPRCRTL